MWLRCRADQTVILGFTIESVGPSANFARLRMFTSLGHHASNLDFVLTPQGQVGGREMLVATHSVRAYSDRFI